jgi:uncharacterized membrane protein
MFWPIALAVVLHILAAVIWVGGMFFAYLGLRPAAGGLEPPARLALWRGVFDRFLPWVWGSVIVLLASGYYLVFAFYGGFDIAGLPVMIMHAVGWVMAVLFAVLYFGPYRTLGAALDGGDMARAADALGGIRRIIAINLPLGLLTVIVAASAHFWR